MKLKFVDKKKDKAPIFKKKPDPLADRKADAARDRERQQTRSPERQVFKFSNPIKDIKKDLYTSEDVRALGAGTYNDDKLKENVAGKAALDKREKEMPAAVKAYKEKKENAALQAEIEESLKGTRFEKKKK